MTDEKKLKEVRSKFSSQKIAPTGKNWKNTVFDKIQQNEKVNTFLKISSKTFRQNFTKVFGYYHMAVGGMIYIGHAAFLFKARQAADILSSLDWKKIYAQKK